jgi:hypothetical protein
LKCQRALRCLQCDGVLLTVETPWGAAALCLPYILSTYRHWAMVKGTTGSEQLRTLTDILTLYVNMSHKVVCEEHVHFTLTDVGEHHTLYRRVRKIVKCDH